jgi:hypothetical protein
MKKDDLLIENVQEIMKLQAWLKRSGESINELFIKTESDDPEKNQILKASLNLAYDAIWDCVDHLQQNAQTLLGIGPESAELSN